jgi:hypothetical protein
MHLQLVDPSDGGISNFPHFAFSQELEVKLSTSISGLPVQIRVSVVQRSFKRTQAEKRPTVWGQYKLKGQF